LIPLAWLRAAGKGVFASCSPKYIMKKRYIFISRFYRILPVFRYYRILPSAERIQQDLVTEKPNDLYPSISTYTQYYRTSCDSPRQSQEWGHHAHGFVLGWSDFHLRFKIPLCYAIWDRQWDPRNKIFNTFFLIFTLRIGDFGFCVKKVQQVLFTVREKFIFLSK
jgi:hypothetical protein